MSRINKKDQYRAYCRLHPDMSLFQQDWWLDAVCGWDGWDVALVEEQGGICAVLPFVQRRKWLFTFQLMPQLTLWFKPLLNNPYTDDQVKAQSYEKKVLEALIQQLPQSDWCIFHLSWHLYSWQPFFWRGFHQTTRYVYGIESPLQDDDALLRSYGKSARKQVLKAEKTLRLHRGLPLDAFQGLLDQTFSRQHLSNPFVADLLERLHEVCGVHQCGEIWYAADDTGNVHCASWVVWDSESLYFMLSGGDPVHRKSGAKFLLYHRMIKLAAEKGLSLNCAGSMMENVAYVFRQLGAIPLPYHSIFRVSSPLLRTYLFLRGKNAW